MANLIIRKFDWWMNDYETYDYPEEWDVAVYDPSYRHAATCASCGGHLEHESAYPSMELCTSWGYPIRVCASCLDAELKRRIEAWEHHQEVDG